MHYIKRSIVYGAVLTEILTATQPVNQLPVLKNTTASFCVLRSL